MSDRRRRIPASLIAGAIMLAVLVVIAVVAPIVWGARATTVTADTRMPPSPA